MQVEGQSFFHIDEIIDPKVAREKASTAVILWYRVESLLKTLNFCS